jgi:RNA polymerase sigma factor (sigma-70 family)
LKLDHHTDEVLVALMQDAHPRQSWTVQAAFDELVSRHQDRVNGRLRLKLPGDEADDQTQEVFLALFDAVLVKGHAVDHVGAWLNGVAAKKVADFYRGRGGQHLTVGRATVWLDDDTADAPARELPDEGEQGGLEAELVVAQLIARRSEAHQAIVRLYVLEGRSAKESSDATGESENNVYKVAQRFRDDLRAALRGEDPSTEDRT